MSTWSPPYLSVTDADGVRVAWTLPDPPPWPAGASAARELADVGDLGLPGGGKVTVRWRTPAHQHPRKRTAPTTDLRAVALAYDIAHAARAGGHGWAPDARGWPVQVSDAPTPVPPAPAADPTASTSPAPALAVPASLAPLAGPYAAVSPDNGVLADIRAGRRQLGSTVADVIEAVRRQREPGWTPKHRVNANNEFGFLAQVLVYAEPRPDELPEVAAWMRARLALPGVQLGASMHVALLLAPDLERAIETRRYTDRRVALLNAQAEARYDARWEAYQRAVAQRATRPRAGRAPSPPSGELTLRTTAGPVSARTEAVFAQRLSTVLGYAEQHGLLVGPNPWPAFAARGTTGTGYRRPAPLRAHRRNVPPVGTVVDLADHIATLGPRDPSSGRPAGDRFRALILTSLLGARPSEIDALDPDDFLPGTQPQLLITKSQAAVHRAATADGSSLAVRRGLKHRALGSSRTVGMPRYVADAVTEHLERGYASTDHLFTSPRGQALRWGNIEATYWRPAVSHVLGSAGDETLSHMRRSWLRKTAITWLLRAGLDVVQVAALTGHDVKTLYGYYAGVVAGYARRHTWTGWDDAWEWAAGEHLTTTPREEQ